LSSIERKGKNITIIKNVRYTPCSFVPKKGAPIWSVSAEQVIDDNANQDITYKKASLNLWGQKIVTVPTFTYPRPNVKRRSGILAPEIQIETDNGVMLALPYFYEIDKSKDLTVEPIFYTQHNPLLHNRFRQKTNHGYIDIDTAFTFGPTFNNNNVQNDNNRFRGFIVSRGRLKISDTEALGFDLNRVSDDTFLRRFDFNDPTFLQSRAFYSKKDQYQNLYVSMYGFQITDGVTDDDTVPMVLPFIDYKKQLKKKYLKGDVFLKANFLGVHRDQGLDTRRAIVSSQWVRNVDMGLGFNLELDNEIRGDLYHTSQGADPSDSARLIDRGFTGRFLPRSSAKLSLPLIKKTKEAIQILEPAIQAVWTPYGNNPDDIPNEDGFITEFDAVGLFDAQRFYGYDLVESGPRFNAGLRYLLHLPNKGSFETQFGQSFRLKEEARFASYTGLDGKSSDYVGRFVINYKDHIHLTHRYRLENDNLNLSLSDLTLDAGTKNMRFAISHFSVDNFSDTAIFDNAEQLSIGSRVSINKNWHLLGGYRQNVQTKETLETRGGIMYTDECLVVSLAVGREFLRLNDIEPSTSLRLRVRLLAAGNDQYNN